MARLIIFVYGYDGPESNNANAICVHNMIGYLKSCLDITIITTTEKQLYCQKSLNDVQIHYLPIDRKANNKLNFKKWNRVALNFLRDLSIINDKATLLTVSFPFNMLILGHNIKQKIGAIPWYIYEMDPFAYNEVLKFSKLAFPLRYFLERKVFKACDGILLTHELFSTYNSNLFSEYSHIFHDVGIPALIINDNTDMPKSEKTIKTDISVAYVGSFYKRIRNPEYLFKLIGEIISANDDIYFHFYGSSRESVDGIPADLDLKRIIFHGRVSRLVVEKSIRESDILVNIGNSMSNQLPSKILEYAGTGKPIVNIYTNDNDSSNNFLANYPIKCFIKEDLGKVQDNAKKLLSFILTNQGRTVSHSILRKIYEEDLVANVTWKVALAMGLICDTS